MNLFGLAQNTQNKNDFLHFLEALTKDYATNKSEWENYSVETFLEAIHSWASDYSGSDLDLLQPSWKEIAALFYMGKIYE